MRKLFILAAILCILGCSKGSPGIPHTYLISSSNSNGDSDWYYYDQRDRIVRIEHKNATISQTTVVSYNGVSWLVNDYIVRNNNHLQSTKNVYSYDGGGTITKLQVYDSLSPAGFVLTRTWEYNWSPQTLVLKMLHPSGVYGPYYRYTWNNAENIISMQRYDSLDRLNYREEDSLFDDKRGILYSFQLPSYQSLSSKNNPTTARIYPSGTGASALVNYQYTYNTDGYVTKAILPGLTLNYVYERR